jgi:hypothetical protein
MVTSVSKEHTTSIPVDGGGKFLQATGKPPTKLQKIITKVAVTILHSAKSDHFAALQQQII